MKDEMNCPENVQDENIITLINDDGEKVEFYEVAFIGLNGSSYSILQPINKIEEMDDDEAFVFEVIYENDEEFFEFVEDEEIINSVFDEYERLLELEEKK